MSMGAMPPGGGGPAPPTGGPNGAPVAGPNGGAAGGPNGGPVLPPQAIVTFDGQPPTKRQKVSTVLLQRILNNK